MAELSDLYTLVALANEFINKYSISEIEALKMVEKELENNKGE